MKFNIMKFIKFILWNKSAFIDIQGLDLKGSAKGNFPIGGALGCISDVPLSVKREMSQG